MIRSQIFFNWFYIEDANNLLSIEQAAKTQPKQDKSFSFIFHHFSSFLTVYLLLKCWFWLDKGDFPKNVRVKINTRSFEPFRVCVWFYINFIRWHFWTPSLTLDSRAHYHVVRSFPSFNLTSPKCIWLQEALVLRIIHGRNACGIAITLSSTVFCLCGVSCWLCMAAF